MLCWFFVKYSGINRNIPWKIPVLHFRNMLGGDVDDAEDLARTGGYSDRWVSDHPYKFGACKARICFENMSRKHWRACCQTCVWSVSSFFSHNLLWHSLHRRPCKRVSLLRFLKLQRIGTSLEQFMRHAFKSSTLSEDIGGSISVSCMWKMAAEIGRGSMIIVQRTVFQLIKIL